MQLVAPGIHPLPGPPWLFYRSFLSHLCLSPVSTSRCFEGPLVRSERGQSRTFLSSTQGLHQGVGSKLPHLDGGTDISIIHFLSLSLQFVKDFTSKTYLVISLPCLNSFVVSLCPQHEIQNCQIKTFALEP